MLFTRTILLLAVLLLSINTPAFSGIIDSGKQTASGGPMCFAYFGGANKLYFTTNTTTDNLWVYDIDPQTGYPSGNAMKFTVNNSDTNYSLAIDPARRKLYVGAGNVRTNDLFVCDLSETGLPVGGFRSTSSYPNLGNVTSIMIDPAKNKIYGTGGLGVPCDKVCAVSLSETGEFLTDTSAATSGGGGRSGLLINSKRNIVYWRYVGNISVAITNDSGHLISPAQILFSLPGSSGSFYTASLDATRRLIYVTNTRICLIRLNASGNPSDTVDLGNVPYSPYIHVLDPARGFMVYSRATTSYLQTATLDGNHYPDTTSTDTAPNQLTIANPSCMFINPYQNKLYAGSYNAGVFDIYSVTLPPLTPVKINDGETITTNRNVKLKLQAANCQFIYVKSDGLSSIGAPVNSLDKWVYVGEDWSNDGGASRATTLEVDAVLSEGFNGKTITMYYIEQSAGHWNQLSNCPTSISYLCTTVINLADTASSVSSISLEKIQYGGIKVRYSVKDAYNRPVTVSAMYSVNGGEYANVTSTQNGESFINVSSSLNGTEHYFVWDSDKDLFGQSGKITMKMKADNGIIDGQWKYSDEYSIPDGIAGLTIVDASKRLADGSWRFGIVLGWNYSSGYFFEVQKKENNGDWSSTASLSDTYFNLMDLSDTTMYYFKVRARNAYGLSSSFSDSVFIVLSRTRYEESIIDEKGATVQIEDYDGIQENNARIVIPEGAISRRVKLIMTRYSDEIYEIRTADEKTNAEIYDFSFRKPVELILPYDYYEIRRRNWDENKLSIFFFDNVNWIQIGSSVNREKRCLSTKLHHLTKFRIMEATTYQKNVLLTPNFFTPNGDGINDRIRFNFPQRDLFESNAVIEIYDIEGKTITFIQIEDSSSVEWNGIDAITGRLCESGTYIYRIKGKEKTYGGTFVVSK